jgi:polysaccharide biosynthesis/export protein
MMRLMPALAVALLLAGCASLDDAAPPLAPMTVDVYRLDSGDRLRITVFGQADLSGEFSVDGSGAVALPLVQSVAARGKTTDELAQHLKTVLSEKFLRDPVVSVEVAQYRPFYILGEVNRPGQYAYVNGMTVKTAAAIAGGFTFRAATSQVVITRRAGDATREGSALPDAPVLPGDTVFVGERVF